MWKMPCHHMIKHWIFVAKEVLKNLNEVPWNDSGTEVILPKNQGSRPFWHLELSKLAKVT